MGKGSFMVELRTAFNALPVEEGQITVEAEDGTVLYTENIKAGSAGMSATHELEAPDKEVSLDPDTAERPYGRYRVKVNSQRFYKTQVNGVQIFDGIKSVLVVEMIPLPESIPDSEADAGKSYEIPPKIVSSEEFYKPKRYTDREITADNRSDDVIPVIQILAGVFIPETIIVHLGAPTSTAENVTVSFKDYIKNVASSEIYPTWPIASLRANIIAQISLTLNRIYTEWYKSRGYDFDITNNTQYDQYFVNGRNIFENISVIVDEIFNTYLTKPGRVDPLFAEYCNGTTSTCPGMSQWGTVSLAENGLTYIDILNFYYGNVEINTTNRIQAISDSYPGVPLKLGDSGENVRIVQEQLNRIAINYPSIPLIPVNSSFDQKTADAVKKFRELFLLGDGTAVDKAVWYSISYIYVAVKRLAELTSEGQRASYQFKQYPGYPIRLGDKGSEVQEIQYYLKTINVFNTAVLGVIIDGIYGKGTEKAVISFQKEYGLTQDGIVGEETWNKLVDVFVGIEDNIQVPDYVISAQPYPGFVIKQGQSGDNVKYIQDLINTISDIFITVSRISSDGIYGPATASSVRSFQTVFGLPITGEVNEATWNKMTVIYLSVSAKCIFSEYEGTGTREYPGADLSIGSRGADVSYIQGKINTLNSAVPYVPKLSVDGIFGALTDDAVRKSQLVFGITMTGVVDYQTWYMYNYLYFAIRTGCLPQSGSGEANEQAAQAALQVIAPADYNVKQIKERLKKVLQERYNISSALGLSENVIGLKTKNALKYYQKKEGLPVTGIPDEATLSRLFEA